MADQRVPVRPYRRRVVDDFLDDFQPESPAITIAGPKGVGKTATALRRAASVMSFDLPADRARLDADPTLLTALDYPVLVDEWQRKPESWDYVRRAVDAGAPAGAYLLTCSATAPRGVTVHSGAGRFIDVRMRPLSFFERDVEFPTVSMSALLRGSSEIGGETDVGLAEYVEEMTASGFPDIRRLSPRVRRRRLEAYVDNIVQREFAEHGYPVRRPATLRAWLRAYAAATSTTTSYNDILDAATAGENDKPSRTTTTVYRDVLAQLWQLDPVEAWLPSRNHLDRLTQAPKHHLADPALAAVLLGLDAEQLMRGTASAADLRDGAVLGHLFEHLVTLSVLVYAEAAEAQVRHLRTKGGDHEVDLIVERRDGRVLALEVKLKATPAEKDFRHLRWLKEQLGDDLVDAAVVTTGQHAYRRNQDGIAVVPLALLGP
ncbi:ATP-binding protein [Isoptericola haloaureus]|uniref:DUF4143 domain-containing protein n=1 Tax=Isoptericola haloaureus TaxID=1542902 RepID=A0ABU7Z3F6_9MICO